MSSKKQQLNKFWKMITASKRKVEIIESDEVAKIIGKKRISKKIPVGL
jgi:hypothetical protein